MVLAALVVAIDRLSKLAIVGAMRFGEAREITSFFNLVLIYNRGAAFSFLSDASGWQRAFFIAIAVIASAIIVALLWRHRRQNLFCLGLALILGGALGNVWDRIQLGYVLDFLDFHALGYHWPAFNAADSSITCGAALLILESFRPTGKSKS